MNEKLKIVIWSVISICILALIGYVSYNFYLSKTEEVIHPQITFEIENYGNVKMELYPEYAPNTVANIVKLVESGYYNNKTIYGRDEICMYVGRNTEGEVEPTKVSMVDEAIEKDSEQDFEYSIEGEFVLNEYNQNTLKHEKGVVTLIRNDYTQYFSDLAEQSYNSGNSQIGIMMNDARTLNGVYAGFGKVIEGFEILEKIYVESSVKTDEENTIETFEPAINITKATVDTFGVTYAKPDVERAFDYENYLNDLLSSYYSTDLEAEGHTH